MVRLHNRISVYLFILNCIFTHPVTLKTFILRRAETYHSFIRKNIKFPQDSINDLITRGLHKRLTQKKVLYDLNISPKQKSIPKPL